MKEDKSGLLKALFETDESKDEINRITEKIIGCAYKVSNELGCGFLEKVYENALMVLLRENNIKAEQQFPIKVYFHRQVVGEYIADISVENIIILELKSQPNITDIHKSQTINYLKATGLKLALLLNFGKQKLEYERLVL